MATLVDSLPDAFTADPAPRIAVAFVRPIAMGFTRLGIAPAEFYAQPPYWGAVPPWRRTRQPPCHGVLPRHLNVDGNELRAVTWLSHGADGAFG